MGKRKASANRERHRFRVTLTCEDGSSPQFTVWAETPEHAIRKTLEQKYKAPMLVVGQTAEEIK